MFGLIHVLNTVVYICTVQYVQYAVKWTDENEDILSSYFLHVVTKWNSFECNCNIDTL